MVGISPRGGSVFVLYSFDIEVGFDDRTFNSAPRFDPDGRLQSSPD